MNIIGETGIGVGVGTMKTEGLREKQTNKEEL